MWDDLDHLRVTGITRLLGIGFDFRFTWAGRVSRRAYTRASARPHPEQTPKEDIGICSVSYPVGCETIWQDRNPLRNRAENTQPPSFSLTGMWVRPSEESGRAGLSRDVCFYRQLPFWSARTVARHREASTTKLIGYARVSTKS